MQAMMTTATLSKIVSRQIRVPVTYGHIAAMEWGPLDGSPILAVHGWQDNAQSFAPLSSLLAQSHGVHFVAVDLPGHGLSSHLGPGATYSHLQYVSAVWQMVQYLGWTEFTLVGHSMGGIVAIIFTAFFPKKITNLVTLDVFYPQLPNKFNANRMEEVIGQMNDLDAREGTPASELMWEEARQAFAKPRALNPANVELLMERAVRPGSREGLVILNRDHRIRQLDGPQFVETQVESVFGQFPNFKGRWLALMADSAKLRRHVDKLEAAKQLYNKMMPSFDALIMPVDGHYFHMEHSDLVAPHVQRLLDGTGPSSKL